jgi:predicted  nucleic acid-binding Zn-ribbon protein
LIDVEPLDEAVSVIKSPGPTRFGAPRRTASNDHRTTSTLDEEITSLRNARISRADRPVARTARPRYQGVMSRVGITGAAQVEAGRCDGCRIALSPLDVDRWKAQAPGTFMACPECGRLLLP